MNSVREILVEIVHELERAMDKFPGWPTDPLHALAVVGEEFGELTQATLQHVYEPGKSELSDVEREAIQLAAMSVRFLMSLKAYRFEPGEEHRIIRLKGLGDERA